MKEVSSIFISLFLLVCLLGSPQAISDIKRVSQGNMEDPCKAIKALADYEKLKKRYLKRPIEFSTDEIPKGTDTEPGRSIDRCWRCDDPNNPSSCDLQGEQVPGIAPKFGEALGRIAIEVQDDPDKLLKLLGFMDKAFEQLNKAKSWTAVVRIYINFIKYIRNSYYSVFGSVIMIETLGDINYTQTVRGMAFESIENFRSEIKKPITDKTMKNRCKTIEDRVQKKPIENMIEFPNDAETLIPSFEEEQSKSRCWSYEDGCGEEGKNGCARKLGRLLAEIAIENEEKAKSYRKTIELTYKFLSKFKKITHYSVCVTIYNSFVDNYKNKKQINSDKFKIIELDDKDDEGKIKAAENALKNFESYFKTPPPPPTETSRSDESTEEKENEEKEEKPAPPEDPKDNGATSLPNEEKGEGKDNPPPTNEDKGKNDPGGKREFGGVIIAIILIGFALVLLFLYMIWRNRDLYHRIGTDRETLDRLEEKVEQSRKSPSISDSALQEFKEQFQRLDTRLTRIERSYQKNETHPNQASQQESVDWQEALRQIETWKEDAIQTLRKEVANIRQQEQADEAELEVMVAQKIKESMFNIALSPETWRISDITSIHHLCKKELTISNEGVAPAKLKEIRIIGEPTLAVNNSPQAVTIPPGDSLEIEAGVNFHEKSVRNGIKEGMGIWLVFENRSNIFWPVSIELPKVFIKSHPSNIQIDPAIAKHRYSETLKLVNLGQTDLSLSVECDEILKKCITIIKPSDSKIKLPSPFSSKKPEGELKILIQPDRMDQGPHKGMIRLRTEDKKDILRIPVQLKVIEPEPLENYIGIDFGTSNSVICLYREEKDDLHIVQVEGPDEKTPLIPSILAFDDSPENFKIGWEALLNHDQKVLSPDFAVRSLKRIMIQNTAIKHRKFFGKKFTQEEMVGCALRKLVELAENEYANLSGGKYYNIIHAILTTPSNFRDYENKRVLRSCELAGLDPEEEISRKIAKNIRSQTGQNADAGIILNEPCAAALSYLCALVDGNELPSLREKLLQQRSINMLIFDYGGGTLDVSVIQANYSDKEIMELQVLSSDGNSNIGGDYIDITVLKALLEACKLAHPKFDNTLISMPFLPHLENRKESEQWGEAVWKYVLVAREQWKKGAETVKVNLSEQKETVFDTHNFDIPIFYLSNGQIEAIRQPFRRKVNEALFKSWIDNILSECERIVRKVVGDLDKTEIDCILHTGRSSLLPIIRKRVKSIFPHLPAEMDILDEEQLKVCVARGAAIYGAQRHGVGGNKVCLVRGPHSPPSVQWDF